MEIIINENDWSISEVHLPFYKAWCFFTAFVMIIVPINIMTWIHIVILPFVCVFHKRI